MLMLAASACGFCAHLGYALMLRPPRATLGEPQARPMKAVLEFGSTLPRGDGPRWKVKPAKARQVLLFEAHPEAAPAGSAGLPLPRYPDAPERERVTAVSFVPQLASDFAQAPPILPKLSIGFARPATIASPTPRFCGVIGLEDFTVHDLAARRAHFLTPQLLPPVEPLAWFDRPIPAESTSVN
jgi:hypothetical protein